MCTVVQKDEPRLPMLRVDVNQNRRSKWGGIVCNTKLRESISGPKISKGLLLDRTRCGQLCKSMSQGCQSLGLT